MLDGLVTPAQLTAAGVAAMELAGYVMDHFENATGSGSSGLITDLAARYASGELDHLTAMNIMLTLFSAAGESTASLLGNAAWILVTQPDIQSQLRANSALMSAFIEETLRYEAPFRGHYRHVMRDTELGGIDLPADSRLLLMWGAANRDPKQVGAPNEFRLDRQGAQGHLTFGKGAHFCVGAALARLEAKVVLRMLIDQTSWIEAVDISSGCPAFSFAGWSDLSSPSGDLSSTVVANCASGRGARLNPTRRRAWIPVPSKPNTGKNATAISCGPDGVGDQRPPTPVDVGVATANAVECLARKYIETGQNGLAHAGEREQHAVPQDVPIRERAIPP